MRNYFRKYYGLKIVILTGLLVLPFLFTACSGSESDTVTPLILESNSDLPISEKFSDNSNHSVMGIWELNFDPDSLSISTSLNSNFRDLDLHFNLTPFLPPDFVVNSFDPWTGVLNVDATITNTFDIDGYDLRLIVYTDDNGNRLLNADNWTSLHDIPGGSQINPFRAYAKNEDNRIFEAFGSHTETLQLYFPVGITTLDFAIDVSYPDNCEEPYEIMKVRQGVLTSEPGSETYLEVDVFDWQNDMAIVRLHCPSVTGVPLVIFTNIGANRWRVNITNDTGASVGDYTGYIIAQSFNSGPLSAYDEITIHITDPASTGLALTWGGPEGDHAFDMTTDNDGNIFVGGFFWVEVDFDPGVGVELHRSKGHVDAFVSKFDPDGNFLWARTWGGGSHDQVEAVTTDNYGNSYLGGMFSDTVDFDPGPGKDEYTSRGSQEAFVSKFDPNGNFQWVAVWGSSSWDTVHGITTDDDNNVYAAGIFTTTVDFDPGAGVTNKISHGSQDAFLNKLDSNRNFQWVRTWGGTDWDGAWGVAITESDNVYVNGVFWSGTIDLNPESGSDSHSSRGGSDMYLSKLDVNGFFIWGKTWGGPQVDISYDVAIDNNDNAYVIGHYENTVDFDPGPGVVNHSSPSNEGLSLSKFDTSGAFNWVRVWKGEPYTDNGHAVITNGVDAVFTTGPFTGTVDFLPGTGEDIHSSVGERDVFLNKFNLDGDYQWVRTWGSTKLEKSYGIAAEGTEKIYTAGQFYNSIDFDPGPNEDVHSSNGKPDVFIVQLNQDGEYE